jgi:hypothetical protein
MFRHLSHLLLSGFLLASAWADTTPTYPDWWLDQGVVDSQPPASGENGYDAWMDANYAPANLGQAKNLVEAAYLEMEADQTGSGGTDLKAMVAAFSMDPACNYVPLNLGQLKALSKKVYDALHSAGFTITLTDGTVIPARSYPWNGLTPVEQNYAPANLGQLKHVFSFDLVGWSPGADTDGDGLFDTLESSIGSDTNSSDTDGNGLSDQTEYLAGYDPVVDISNDADQLPDDWENYYGLDTTCGVDNSSDNSDGDLLTNYQEYYAMTNPRGFNNINTDYDVQIKITMWRRY